MAKNVQEAREKMEKEFLQVREKLEGVRRAMEAVEKAGPEDDLHGLLEKLEDAVKDARTGGVLGSGANGHKRAREEYVRLKAQP